MSIHLELGDGKKQTEWSVFSLKFLSQLAKSFSWPDALPAAKPPMKMPNLLGIFVTLSLIFALSAVVHGLRCM